MMPKYVVLKILAKIKHFACPRYDLASGVFLVSVRQDSLESYVTYQSKVVKTTSEQTSQRHLESMKFGWTTQQ